MKSEKGVTLISLTIYVIVMTVVVGIIAVISGIFFKNINDLEETNPLEEYTNFNTYFSNEVNKEGIKVLKYDSDYIIFDNGVQYTFIQENKGIYMNKVKICKDVQKCIFNYRIEGEKSIIDVDMIIKGRATKTSYTLK